MICCITTIKHDIYCASWYIFTYICWCEHQSCGLNRYVLWLCALVTARVACPRLFNFDSDLFEKSDDILAHVCQTDNDVVVVDVAEGGVVSALPPGLLQDQIPAVHSGHEILVLSETAKERRYRLIQQQRSDRAVHWSVKSKKNVLKKSYGFIDCCMITSTLKNVWQSSFGMHHVCVPKTGWIHWYQLWGLDFKRSMHMWNHMRNQ